MRWTTEHGTKVCTYRHASQSNQTLVPKITFVIPTAAGLIPPTLGGEVIEEKKELQLITNGTDLIVSSAVNGTGPFLGSKHAVAQFLKQEPDTYGFRGTIINISSIGGQVGLMRCGKSLTALPVNDPDIISHHLLVSLH